MINLRTPSEFFLFGIIYLPKMVKSKINSNSPILQFSTLTREKVKTQESYYKQTGTMSIHRAHSAYGTTGQSQRPFSTNNPFRNASVEAVGASNSQVNQQNFQRWVQMNQSQLSFSEDDEEEFTNMPPPRSVRPSNGRTSSHSSTGSGNSASRSMPPPIRRASNNPFQQSLSAQSTSDRHVTPPSYPPEANDQSSTDYYNSSTEKQRQREREREIERQAESELPPSYEEAAGPAAAKNREYPREKESSATRSSRSRSHSEGHRTRVHREYHGDDPREARKSSSRRSGEQRSERRSERPSDRERRHRDQHREHREHREKDREHRSSRSSGHRHRSSPEKSKSKSSKQAPPPKNVDTIDKLDVTGLFGGAFHHDGPFDACTPHRNNKDNKAAPVLAFPADGPNSSIRGSSNTNFKKQTINYIHGREDDDDDLYTSSVAKQHNSLARGYVQNSASQDTLAAIKANQNIIQFDTNAKADPVHGKTTLGLGSSTFLDGAPAAKSVAVEELQRGVSLNRKKSFRQRLTGSADSPRPSQSVQNGTKTDLEEDKPIKFASSEKEDSIPGGNSLLKRVRSLKVGRSKS